MFMLVWEWVDEDTGYLSDPRIDWFNTKHELIEAYHNARMEYMDYINDELLLLSAAVSYDWPDIETLF